jgi:predicted dehydrogenase
MAQLLVALEKNEKPAIDGRDNLMTMALVEAAYKSVASKRLVTLDEITGNTFREGPL